MTSDLPYFPFYPGDWVKATRMLSPQAKGAWIDILAALWSNTKRRGTLAIKPSAWARLLGLPEPDTLTILSELSETDTCEREDLPDGRIQIASRRMMRDADNLAADAKSCSEHARSAANTRWRKKRSTPVQQEDAPAMPEQCPSIASASIEQCPSNTQAMPKNAKSDSDNPPIRENPKSTTIPTLQATLEFAKVRGLNPEVAQTWWYDRDGEGWARLTGQWTSNLTSYIRKWESRQAESRHNPNHTGRTTNSPPKPIAALTDAEILKASL